MPQPYQRVLIVGCGYLGSALAERLRREGHRVWGLRRDVERLPAGVQPVEADLRVPRTLRRLPDVDVAYYLLAPDTGGETAAGGGKAPDVGRETASSGLAADGLATFLAALEALRIRLRHLFYISSLESFGHTDGRWVDEDSAPDGSHPRARPWLEAEKIAAEAAYPATVVRLGDLYGPGRPGLLEAVVQGDPLDASVVGGWANPVHRDDAAAGLVHFLGRRRRGGLYVLADREPVRRLELAGWLAAQLDRPPPVIDGATATPAGAARPDVRALSERLVEFGHRFVYPTYREGYRTLLRRVR